MDELIREAYDPEDFRKKGHKLIDLLADHIKDSIDKKLKKVSNWKDPESRFAEWKKRFMKDGSEDFETFIKDLLKGTINIHNPNYMGHQVSLPLPYSGIADMINGCLNNGSAIYEMGPAPSAMEKVVIQWLSKEIGMTDRADGFLTSGGSAGNLTGLLAARQAISDFDIWEKGQGNNKYAIMVSTESHYSIERAVKILGWGEKGIIKVPVDNNFCLDPSQLEGLYLKAKNEGIKVIAVVGNACSTSTGSYDPCDLIADFCEKKHIWFHIDGAHGAPAALTENFKYLTRGIERADSIVIDFHKMLLSSSLATAVIFKNGERSYETFAQHASYIFNSEKDYKWFNSGTRTLECTKNMMAVKIYMILSLSKTELFKAYITRQYELARKFADIIIKKDNYELATYPQSNILCFRYTTPELNSNEEINKSIEKIRLQLIEEGEFYIVQTKISEISYFRLSLMNPFTGMEEFENLLERIEKTYLEIKENLIS